MYSYLIKNTFQKIIQVAIIETLMEGVIFGFGFMSIGFIPSV